jgi:hypothetical protein
VAGCEGDAAALWKGEGMNKNSVMTALLTIEMVTVFIIGIWVFSNYTNVKLTKEENVALKTRVEEMQKSNTQLNALVKTQTRDKQDCLTLSKVSRGVWDKRLKECEEKQNNWVQEACGIKCAVYVELANKCIKGVNELSEMAKEKP